MRRALILACVLACWAAPAEARHESLADRVDDLQQQVESLTEDVEDLQEPVEEFELFDQCAHTLGVTQHRGYLWGFGGDVRRPALALDIRGFGTPQFDFLAFPGEEPPSIECNEDANEEFIDG